MANLRVVSKEDNNLNRKKYSNNVTGNKGITFRRNRWRAVITVKKKRIELGTFLTKEEAIKARVEAEEKYFGIYNRDLNNIETEYYFPELL